MLSSRFLRPVTTASRSTTALLSSVPRHSSKLFHTTTANMVVQHVNSAADFERLVLKANKPVVVDSFATWCGPCKAIAPFLEKWSGTFDNVDFVKFDVDELPELSQELGVRAMPTFFFFQNGEKIHEIIGGNPKALEPYLKELHEKNAQ